MARRREAKAEAEIERLVQQTDLVSMSLRRRVAFGASAAMVTLIVLGLTWTPLWFRDPALAMIAAVAAVTLLAFFATIVFMPTTMVRWLIRDGWLYDEDLNRPTTIP